MKPEKIEVLLVVIALLATIATVAAAESPSPRFGMMEQKDSPQASEYYINSRTGQPDPYPYPYPYPHPYPPPPFGSIQAPTNFPWWRMPTLPEESHRITVPPVFVPPDPDPKANPKPKHP